MKIEYKTRRNPPFAGNLAIVEYWEGPSSCPLTVEGFEQGSACYDDLGKAKELLRSTHPGVEILSEIPILVGRVGQRTTNAELIPSVFAGPETSTSKES